MSRIFFSCFAFALALLLCNLAMAEDLNKSDFKVSPKDPWGDLSKIENQDNSDDESVLSSILLYLPNRVLDFIDIFRADVGVGPAVGGVVRISKYGQAGIRTIAPLSARVGLFGREIPFMLERSSELGIGPAYLKSKDRKVCVGELGAGVDLMLIGAYLGICTDEVADFLGGIFMYDFKEDDFH